MKDILLKNFEKVLLTFLLLILAGCSVYMILTMDRDTITIVTEGAGAGVKVVKVTPATVVAVALEADKAQPYDSKGYIYCRNLECNYLIHRSLPKCPWCDEGTRPPPEGSDTGRLDSDGDGISNNDEIKMGLNPEDATDALKDKDSDGFSNLDEVKALTDIDDPSDHPSIINRAKLHAKIRKVNYYPITFSNFGINNESDKKTWDIYADIYTKRGAKSVFSRINDHIKDIGYTIIDVNRVDGKESITIQREGEEPVVIKAGKKKTAKNIEYIVQNELVQKYVMFELGGTFELVDKAGNKETYKAESFDLKARTLLVIDYKTKSNVKLGLVPKMDEPGAKVNSETPEFNELDLLRR